MYRKAELRKAGLLSINGEENASVSVDSEQILKSLNELNDTSSKNVIETVIKSTMYEISAEMSNTEYNTTTEITKPKDVIRMNIIDNFMNELSYVLISTLFSPKVYLLMAVNLKIMGEEPKFVLKDFIDNNKNIIIDMIIAVKDQLVQYIVSELMKQLSDIVKEISSKIAVEQIRYNMRLLKRCLDCFKNENNNGIIGWNMDNVDYADIYQENNIEQPIPEC